MIPRRVAYRIWAASLSSQARRLRDLAKGRGADRRRGRVPVLQLAEGLRIKAKQLAAAAEVLASWIGGGGPPGGDLDPAIVVMVATYLSGRAEVIPELIARCGRSGRRPAPHHAETIPFLRWILEG